MSFLLLPSPCSFSRSFPLNPSFLFSVPYSPPIPSLPSLPTSRPAHPHAAPNFVIHLSHERHTLGELTGNITLLPGTLSLHGLQVSLTLRGFIGRNEHLEGRDGPPVGYDMYWEGRETLGSAPRNCEYRREFPSGEIFRGCVHERGGG